MRTLIVGGGLSGLAIAERLQAEGLDYLLVEARDRFGGRIKTVRMSGAAFDLGPAWFWPGQPRMAALVDRLGLEKFDQFADGLLTFEDERGQVQRGRGFASMQGSWRLDGGFGALIDALVTRLPAAHLRLTAPVTALAKTDRGLVATLQGGDEVHAGRVILALPPRVAANIAFAPALPEATVQAMMGIATWMAGQAKALALYDRPFWRAAGLSGDAMSRFGPMVEVHDASPRRGGPYGLFGFIGVAPQDRRDAERLRQQVLAQFVRLFGDAAANPLQLYIEDWARAPFTATGADCAPLQAHPRYGLPRDMTGLWDGRLHFAGTEAALHFGGYLEGALEAAENLLGTLRDEEVSAGHVD